MRKITDPRFKYCGRLFLMLLGASYYEWQQYAYKKWGGDNNDKN